LSTSCAANTPNRRRSRRETTGTAGRRSCRCWPSPIFRSCQRFRLASGRGHDYLALWTLESPDAFNTTAYKSDWGFFDWERYVTDWSRDLFDGGDRPESTFAVPAGGSLSVVSFDGMSPDEARVACSTIAPLEPDMRWPPVIGLDRHTSMIGLDPRPDRAQIETMTKPAESSAQQAIYWPISDLYTTASA